MRNRFFRFVAHVGEAEGLAFDFAVAAVDDKMMFFAQVAHEFRHVDAAIIFDAGESEGAKVFFGEKFETSSTHPVVDKRVSAGVTRTTRRQSFAENFFEF